MKRRQLLQATAVLPVTLASTGVLAQDKWGQGQGYPMGLQGGLNRDPLYRVGNYSGGFEKLFPHHTIKAMSQTVAPYNDKPTSLAYRWGFFDRTPEDYLHGWPVTGLLLARGDNILFERYQYERTSNMRLTSWSMAKSVTSLLLGICLDMKLIDNYDDPADKYVPSLKGKRMGIPPDQIVYLKGGNPIELLNVADFQAVYADMHMQLLRVEPEKKAVKVYVEDDEAALFLLAILTSARKKFIKDETGFKLEVVPVHVGCANLVGLIKADDHFKSVVIAIDADANGVKGSKAPNVVRLPVDPLNSKKQSPEVILREMCQKMVDDPTAYPATKKMIRSQGADESYLQQYILGRKKGENASDKPIEEDREVAKAWFNNRLENIKGMKLIEGWVADNATGVQKFMRDLTRAVIAATSDPLPQAQKPSGKKVTSTPSSMQKVPTDQHVQSAQ